MLHRKREVLVTECEMCYVHSLLSKIPPDLPMDALVIRAGDLFVQYPPNVLEEEAKMESEKYVICFLCSQISSWSVSCSLDSLISRYDSRGPD